MSGHGPALDVTDTPTARRRYGSLGNVRDEDQA
jgi:hypothetical protein